MKKSARTYVLLSILLVVVIIFSGTTFQRNAVWKNNFTLFSNDIPRLENCSRCNYQYANALALKFQENPDPSLPEKIIDYYNKAIELSEHSYNARFELGKFYIMLGQADQARPIMEALVAQFPEEGRAYYFLGYCAYFQQQYDDAIANFRISAEMAPNRIDTYLYWAWSLYSNNAPQQAISLLEDRLEADPSATDLYIALSDFNFGSGNPEEGHAVLERAISQIPDYKPFYEKMIQRYYEGRNEEKAMEYQRRLEQLR